MREGLPARFVQRWLRPMGTRCLWMTLVVMLAAVDALAAADAAPSDLTVWNLATTGWDEPWAKRAHSAPDMALLRVQTNFLERELRVNYVFENDLASSSRRNRSEAEALVAYGIDRRLMFAVATRYDELEGRGARRDEGGATGAIAARLQLIDTADSSYALSVRASAPNRGNGEHRTTLSYGIAGFEDLTRRFGLDRLGLYYHLLFDSAAGPAAPGARRHDVSYDVSIAKTVTPADTPLFGNLSFFAEALAQSDLDGVHAGRTALSFTPGARFDVGRGNWLMGGIDVPVKTPERPYELAYRVTYILNF